MKISIWHEDLSRSGTDVVIIGGGGCEIGGVGGVGVLPLMVNERETIHPLFDHSDSWVV